MVKSGNVGALSCWRVRPGWTESARRIESLTRSSIVITTSILICSGRQYGREDPTDQDGKQKLKSKWSRLASNCFDWFSVCSYFNEELAAITSLTPVNQPIKLIFNHCRNEESSQAPPFWFLWFTQDTRFFIPRDLIHCINSRSLRFVWLVVCMHVRPADPGSVTIVNTIWPTSPGWCPLTKKSYIAVYSCI